MTERFNRLRLMILMKTQLFQGSLEAPHLRVKLRQSSAFNFQCIQSFFGQFDFFLRRVTRFARPFLTASNLFEVSHFTAQFAYRFLQFVDSLPFRSAGRNVAASQN